MPLEYNLPVDEITTDRSATPPMNPPSEMSPPAGTPAAAKTPRAPRPESLYRILSVTGEGAGRAEVPIANGLDEAGKNKAIDQLKEAGEDGAYILERYTRRLFSLKAVSKVRVTGL